MQQHEYPHRGVLCAVPECPGYVHRELYRTRRKFTVRLVVEIDPQAWNEEYSDRETWAGMKDSAKDMVVEGAKMAVAHLTPTVLTVKEA